MTDATPDLGRAMPVHRGASLHDVDSRTRSRRAAESRFRAYGLIAIGISLAVLAVMLFTIIRDGSSGFRQTSLTFPVMLSAEVLDPEGNRDPADLARVTTLKYAPVLREALAAHVNALGLNTENIPDAQIAAMVSDAAPGEIRARVLADPALIGTEIEVSTFATGRIDGYFKGRVTMESAALDRNTSPEQLRLAERMRDAGLLSTGFNWRIVTGTDSSDTRPETAGLGIAILGSLYMMALIIVIALPVGIAASIYLEEFAPKNRLTDLIEVNISNLAAVPSIVFGILGLAIFINFAGLPKSSSIVGALVLSLLVLPTIIIATRAALRAVPPSIRDAAYGLGASRMQAVFHHVLPLAMPGILTGTILALATALGETAPLLLIGMVAFVGTYPGAPPAGIMDPATALPVQVYSWASRSDPAFLERSSAAIIVLLLFLVLMNALAIVLRRRFERRW